MYKKLILIVGVILVMASAYAQKNKVVQTIEKLEIDRFLGTWYEIASAPTRFQKNCVANSKADYSLMEIDLLKIENSCDTKNGTTIAEGRAKIKDTKTNAKLTVTFTKFISWVYLFGGDFWVLDIASDYSYALIGEPGKRYAWVLSREQTLSDIKLERAYKILNKNGYDTCLVFTTAQSNGIQERRALCDIFE